MPEGIRNLDLVQALKRTSPVSRPITGSTTLFLLSAAADPMTILKSERRGSKVEVYLDAGGGSEDARVEVEVEFRTTNGTIWS